MLTTRIPTSSAEMAIPPGRHTSVPKTDGNCCGVAPNSSRRYSRMTRAESDRGDDQGDVVAAGGQQAIDERDLEHVAEQQDGDRDRDDEGGDDPDLGHRTGQLRAADEGTQSGSPIVGRCSPRIRMITAGRTMNSPWAKLIAPAVCHSRAKPTAARAKIAPVARPENVI